MSELLVVVCSEHSKSLHFATVVRASISIDGLDALPIHAEGPCEACSRTLGVGHSIRTGAQFPQSHEVFAFSDLELA